MDKDIKFAIILVAIVVLVTFIIVYLITRYRQQYYIVYVDNKLIKTFKNRTFLWDDLQRTHYIEKRILGSGLKTSTVGLVFHFNSGKATIDFKSNIFKILLQIANNSKAPKTSVITKGLVRKTNN